MGIVQSLFGGAKPSLKPQGPAPFTQPPERDRQALFWWLKRNTSYTAIAHNAKLWSTFAAEFEQWLRSQQEPREHDVTSLKYILDTQISYEQGLKLLKQGDRSVWRYQLSKLYTNLLIRRNDWEAPTPELNASMSGHPQCLVESYFRAHEAAMAVGHGISYFNLDNDPSSSARSLLASLPFDTTTPAPQWLVSFKCGQRAPKDGIYEQVDAAGHIVGGMAFFTKGQSSEEDSGLEFGPQAWKETQQRSSDFFWRLLWEDTRYKDGSIPEEERLYPTPSDSLHPVLAPPPQRLRCEAPNPCPREGWWHTPAQPGSRRFFKTGELMPDLRTDYGATIWEWDAQQG